MYFMLFVTGRRENTN